jgi:hypothetical protein
VTRVEGLGPVRKSTPISDVRERGRRRTWQIAAEKVRIGGKHWAPMLDAILGRVAEGLGIAELIAAELYKLLV